MKSTTPLTEASLKEKALYFKALSDENRLKILWLLTEGELCACNIQEQMSISQSTLSHHMKILVDSSAVSARKEGKWTYYRIESDQTLMVSELLLQIARLGESRRELCDCTPKCNEPYKGE